MKQMNRRYFIKSGAIGFAGITILPQGLAGCKSVYKQDTFVDKVKLGNSGLTVSRIALGTGTKTTSNRSSAQTRLGMDGFFKLAHHAYEQGIRFFDTAETYGSIPFAGEVIKTLPRENLTLLTKMWTQEERPDRPVMESAITGTIDRFRQELNTDYIDILLMHCMLGPGWETSRARYMDVFSKAKQDGILKAVGVSCHSIDALREATVSPWVDVIMARINPFGTSMDGATPEETKNILATAKNNGKGVIGMKIFGEGANVKDEEREQTIHFALHEANVHCMTLGFETIEQMDDAIEKVMKYA